jgi:peptidyl-prolyl cis-trans isomerase C
MRQSGWILSVVLGLGFGMPSMAGVLATVNGKQITDEDLETVIARFPEIQKQNTKRDPEIRKKVVSDLIDAELMVQEASKLKLDTSKQFKDQLVLMRKQALVNLLVEKTLAPKVTPDAIKTFYERNKIRYSTDQVHAHHILLATQKEAESVLAEVKRPGVDFQKVAEMRSKDPAAKNTRGDLGFFGRGMFDEPFTDAAFGARSGEIVGPVRTPYGFHVIKVIDRKVGKIPDLAEVEPNVRADFQRDLLRKLVLDLRKKSTIKE